MVMPAEKRRKLWGNSPKFKVPKTSEASTSANRFQLLSEDEEEEVALRGKIPPIIIDATHRFSDVVAMFENGYTFKRMSIGTKLSSKSKELYEEALRILKNAKFQFYTHEVKNASNFKLVLFGLPKIPTEEIRGEFDSSHNIKLVNIKELETKRSCEDDALYIIEFDRQNVTKSEVMKIRYFFNIAVHWRKPFKGNRGPTQCTKCAMYGHGARNCNRSVVCPACMASHAYELCPLNKATNVSNVVYKCHNCTKRKLKHVNHRADDPKCPSRQEYLDIRARVTTKFRQSSRTNNGPAFYVDDQLFPQLSRQEEPNSTHNVRTNGNSYSEVARNSGYNRNYVRNNDNDISNERLLEIFFEAVDALQKCQNKYDKLRVLGRMLQHAI